MGAPVSTLNSWNGAALSQTVIEALPPATGAMFTLTVTKAVSFSHGPEPFTT
jgi:hypothetical protein